MREPSERDFELAFQVALLHKDASAPLRQKDIAETLGIAQSRVSKLLTIVHTRGWLKTLLNEEAISADADVSQHLSAYKRSTNRDPLENFLQSESPYKKQLQVHVVTGNQFDQFVRDAASPLASLLASAGTIATMWGRTVRGCIEQCERLPRQKTYGPDELTVIPACGEPTFLHSHDHDQVFSASRLAAKLYRAMTGTTNPDSPNLLGVPAYVAKQFRGEKNEQLISRFIRHNPGYGQIFGDQGVINKVDVLVTGLGTLSSDGNLSGAFIRERMAQEKLQFADICDSILGDIGGIVIPKETTKKARRTSWSAKELNKGWVGMSERRFQDCAKNAVRRKQPGVVAIAAGRKRADLVRAVNRRGLASTFILSGSLADAILNLDES